MKDRLIETYNNSFNKMKTLGVFEMVPRYDIKDINLNSYGFKFYHIDYEKYKSQLSELDFKILKDIADIMFISSDGLTDDFVPTITFTDGRRSMALEDLNDEFIDSLYNNAYKLYKDPLILSKIYDVIWSKKKTYYKAAKFAFINYNKILSNSIANKNFQLAYNILPRMLVLAFYAKIKYIYETMCNTLLKLIHLPIDQNNLFFLYQVWEKIININWKDKREEVYKTIANVIENYIYNNKISLNWQESCSNMLCRIYTKLKYFDKQKEILEWIGNKFVEEANYYTLPIQKFHFLSKAIETYRRINKNPLKDKIEELYSQIQILQKQKDNHYQLISQKIDISEQVKNTYNTFKDFDFLSCLYGLWNNKILLLNKRKIEELTETSYKSFFLDYFKCSYENHFGQTVLCTSEGNNTFRMTKYYRDIFWHIHVAPIIDVINEKFFYKQESFEEMVIFNPLIPEGYEKLFSRGMYYFFKGFYIEAATILIPLLENSFRHILSIKHPMIYKEDDQNVFKNKIDLTYLINMVEKEKLLDESLVYHLKDLITDKRYNIRNYIAHGLYPEYMFYSLDIAILLYIVFIVIAEPYFSKCLKEKS